MAPVLCPVLVGRQQEFERLCEALVDARRGRGVCAVLVGEPGIGKSRLARELIAGAEERGMTVLTGRAVPGAGTAAYRPVAEVALQASRRCGLPSDPAFAPFRRALTGIVPGVEAEGPASEPSPAVRGEAVVRLITACAPDGALVVLEDLHWADPDTVALVEYLTDNLTREPILVVLTVRDEPVSPALDLVRRQRGRPGIVQFDLARLSADEVADMVRACDEDAPADVVARVQHAAEGVPLLAEELLAAPGLPRSFAEAVSARLAAMPEEARAVLEAAAVLGRIFDWEILAAVAGTSDDIVSAALADAKERMLVVSDGTGFRFRHALTRDAVMNTVLPPRQRTLAQRAVAVLTSGSSSGSSAGDDLLADLALRAGDHLLAGSVLARSGATALAHGALATAVDALRRAVELLPENDERHQAQLALVDALALAGRVDEAAAVGADLGRAGSGELGAEVHARLARAAVAASRWPMARHHLDEAHALVGDRPGGLRAQLAVLRAEVAMGGDDFEGACSLAREALAEGGVPAEVRCHAFEILGRCVRLHDRREARAAFESALAMADAARLPLWRLRALHELGTVDLFDHAGIDRLLDARRTADETGAVSTAAVLDLQLAAAYTCRWDLDPADRHGRSAAALAERYRLRLVGSKAYVLLAGAASMRLDRVGTEELLALSASHSSEDPTFEGFAWGSRGLMEVLEDRLAEGVEAMARGMAVYGRLPNAEPAAIRAVWPLLLAVIGDRRAEDAVAEARRLGVAAIQLNRGLIALAEAVLAGRRGDREQAGRHAAETSVAFLNCAGWEDLGRFLAAPAALADGWGDPAGWLARAADGFSARGLTTLAARCRDLVDSRAPNPWRALGVTAREADILRLVTEGLANKEIAVRLGLSPRTVEKHVESLLRKTGTRTRTELAVSAGSRSSRPPA